MITNNAISDTSKHADQMSGAFDAAVIEEGILLQSKTNTVSAIEFLKNRGIDAATIQCVLSGFYLHRDVPLHVAGLN